MLLKNDFPFLFDEIEKYLSKYDLRFQFTINTTFVNNSFLEDCFSIKYKNKSCDIQASNKRSLLFAFYKFLRILGFDWVAPGKASELVPSLETFDFVNLEVDLFEKADNNYRGIVLEGAVSVEHVIDLIDYMAKFYYNSYFIQFFSPYYFFKNWYNHVHNPLFKQEAFDKENALEYRKVIIDNLLKRDLLIHDVGHGWTAKALNMDVGGWDALPEEELKEAEEKNRQYLALCSGRRQFFMKIPANTNLCYSQVEVQEKLANCVVNYALNNKEIDYLHFWLADEFNNVCECENCKRKRIADWYVDILNLIDKKLIKNSLSTKIVFLLYNDLLWPPVSSKLNNKERFVMMFAPITRSFDFSLQEDKTKAISEYRYNEVVLPINTAENLAYLRKWKEFFDGDCFDFDYHLGRAHYGDFTYHKISNVLSEDIKNLKNFKLNGMLICQENRAFFPTGLPNYIAGLILWNSKEDFELLSTTYYKKYFKNYKTAQSYLLTIVPYIDMDLWNGKFSFPCCERGENLAKIAEISKSYLENNIEDVELINIIRYAYLFSHALAFEALGDVNKEKAFIDLVGFIRSYEKSNPGKLDCFRVLDLIKKFHNFDVDNVL